MQRGEIYYADFTGAVGSEQGGVRPALILQNNLGNKYSTTVIVAPLTSRDKYDLPTHVYIGDVGKLKQPSYVLLEQLRTLDKIRLTEFLGRLTDSQMNMVNKAIKISVGLNAEKR